MFQQFLNWLYSHEREVIAIISGLIISWAITQRIKFAIPKRWSYHAREVATQGIAFVLGMVATFAIWPHERISDAIVAGLVVGLAAPAIWSVMVLFAGFKFPWVKPLLSQDVRDGVRLSGKDP